MNRRQMRKALKQARGDDWPRRLRWLPANHPERAKWWDRRVAAVFRWFRAISPWDGDEWAREELGLMLAEEGDEGMSMAASWGPVYYSGDARRRAYTARRARELRLGLDGCPF